MARKTAGERWYARLLRVYPRDFRDEFGGEMTRLYRDRRRAEPWWRLWRDLVLDVARTAPSEHLSLLTQDLRYAWRRLRATPLITATAVLTLALGVGATTAIYSVVHAVLLRPLPYPEPDRLVELFEENLTAGTSTRVSALNYLTWAERSRTLESVGASQSAAVTLTGDGDPALLGANVVTASQFRALGLQPIVGRTLRPGDEQRGSPPVVVLGETLWRTRFGGDGRIVGRSITLDGERHQVLGVMPRAFREVGRSQATATPAAQVFLPMRVDRAHENRGNHTLRVVGRLRAGVPVEQARGEMRAVAAAMEREFPATNTGWSVRIEPVSETMVEPQVRRSLLLLLGAVVVVFFIACANVTNLLLARATRRQPELALRTALGAGRARLIRQLLTESSVLAVISGATGVWVAVVADPLVRALLPATLPRLDEMRLDAGVLAVGSLFSLVSGVACGLVPAFRASRTDALQSLTSAVRTTGDRFRPRLRQTLVAVQVALATTLLVLAALLLQAFVRLQHVPLGFEPDNVVTVRMSLPRSGYADAVASKRFYDRLLEMLRASGQIKAVAVGTSVPFAPGIRAAFPLYDGTQPGAGARTADSAAEHIVSADYFRVLDVPLLAGRVFDESDAGGSTAVAVVSQRTARRLWPDANPLGQTLERSGQQYEVVGVVGDVRGSDTQGLRGGGPDREPRAAVYFAASQLPQRTMTLVARTTADPSSVIAGVRAAVHRLDPALPLQQTRVLEDWLAESLVMNRVVITLAALFAAGALLLTSVGIYGVLAYTVASRTREIGVRMAVGATRGRIMGLVLREGMTWAGSGIVLGLVGASSAATFTATLLFEVPARDPVTFAGVGGTMALVAVIACALPAARAVRIDPTIAMRAE